MPTRPLHGFTAAQEVDDAELAVLAHVKAQEALASRGLRGCGGPALRAHPPCARALALGQSVCRWHASNWYIAHTSMPPMPMPRALHALFAIPLSLAVPARAALRPVDTNKQSITNRKSTGC